MSGTREGGQKAAKKNKQNFGSDFYRYIGHLGGRKGHTGGFANNPALAKKAGAMGGRAHSSRRTASEAQKAREAKAAAQEEFHAEAMEFFKKHKIDIQDEEG